MKCECCRQREASVKDYRSTENQTGSFYVCGKCFNMSDLYFFGTMAKNHKILSKTEEKT